MTQTYQISSDSKMSNSAWHRAGQPMWWARVGSGDSAQWLDIPRTRGDHILECSVDVPAGSTVCIGVGRGKGSVREEIECE